MVIAALLAAAPPAPPALALYPDRFFRGERIVLTGSVEDVRLPFAPASLSRSGRWEACSEPRFRGRCIEIDRDFPVDAGLGIGFELRSVRVLAHGTGATRPAPGVAPGGDSLAGVRTRYFPAPRYGGERVLACPARPSDNSMECARDTAEDLCRRAGYRRVEHVALDAGDGRLFLADILCAKER